MAEHEELPGFKAQLFFDANSSGEFEKSLLDAWETLPPRPAARPSPRPAVRSSRVRRSAVDSPAGSSTGSPPRFSFSDADISAYEQQFETGGGADFAGANISEHGRDLDPGPGVPELELELAPSVVSQPPSAAASEPEACLEGPYGQGWEDPHEYTDEYGFDEQQHNLEYVYGYGYEGEGEGEYWHGHEDGHEGGVDVDWGWGEAGDEDRIAHDDFYPDFAPGTSSASAWTPVGDGPFSPDFSTVTRQIARSWLVQARVSLSAGAAEELAEAEQQIDLDGGRMQELAAAAEAEFEEEEEGGELFFAGGQPQLVGGDEEGSTSSFQSAPEIMPLDDLPLVRAVADYQSDDVTELSVHTGDIIAVIQERDSGWWLGAQWLEPNRRGFFPCTYVERVPRSHRAAHTQLRARLPEDGEGERDEQDERDERDERDQHDQQDSVVAGAPKRRPRPN